MIDPRRWYIVQTYSGYESSVKEDLERRIESMGMQNLIFRVVLPEETYIEKDKNGNPKEKVRKMFPGYVFVEMIITDDSWHVIRNTPKVTGFLGSSGGRTKPVPLPQDEINAILLKVGIIEKPTFKHPIGSLVNIVAGPFAGQSGKVVSFDNDKETAIISIEIFGRGTPTEVSFDQVENQK